MKRINTNFWNPGPKLMKDNDPRWGPLGFILKMSSVCWWALIILSWFAFALTWSGHGRIRFNP